MPIKRVSMEDIGQKLGLSKHAVSLALSGKKGVSGETRQLVMQTAQDMGYTVKTGIPPKQGHKAIGLITRELDLREPMFFSIIVGAIQKEIQRMGCNLLISTVSKETIESGTVPDRLLKQPVDGAIILSDIGYPLIQALSKQFPSIVVDHYDHRLEVDTVMTDNTGGALIVMDYLFGQGLESIGFIGNIHYAASYYERYDGYVKAHNFHAKRLDPGLTFTGAGITREQSWESAVTSFIDQLAVLPQAFFCVSDPVTVHVHNLLTRKGLRIPEDISLVGFDDSAYVQYINPPLTMVHIHKNFYGTQAVRQLFKRIENPSKPCELIRIKPKLIIRESVKPALLKK